MSDDGGRRRIAFECMHMIINLKKRDQLHSLSSVKTCASLVKDTSTTTAGSSDSEPEPSP